MMKVFPILFALAAFCRAAEFDHSHRRLDAVLKRHVKDASVDYRWLKANRAELDAYLKELRQVSETEFEKWPEAQQLAFLINLYNAATLQLVIDHYPVKSIKSIGGIFKGPWRQEVVSLFGTKVTLDYVEHGLLRQNYREPRVHFAIVCAAKGCPGLPDEAFTAARLNEQLEARGRAFLRDKQKNRIEPGRRTVYLSPILKWFREDFEAHSGSVLKFVSPYFEPADQQLLNAQQGWRIRYSDYDWSLNDFPAR